MAQRTIPCNQRLAGAIRCRRLDLHLTIEEAAKKAGVGTKTWCRYEAGGSIRQDKYKGVCKALNWLDFPAGADEDETLAIDEYKKHEVWSEYLEEKFGEAAALSFVVGSDILLDHINEDMDELSKLPKDTHIGQIGTSFVQPLLPEQFLMNYDYEFLYAVRSELLRFRTAAQIGVPIIAHSVLAELILHMIVDEAEFLIESDPNWAEENWKDWVYDIFEDDDVDLNLYSGGYVLSDNCYHFNHWLKEQFYCG